MRQGGSSYLEHLPEEVDIVGDDLERWLVEFHEALHAQKDTLIAGYCADYMRGRIPRVLAKVAVIEPKKNY